MLFCLHPSMGQSKRAFSFIDNPSFTKLSGLGGVNLTAGNDPLMFTSNPALLDSTHLDLAAFHYLNLPGGVNVATLGYNLKGPANGILGIGLQYFNYGEFEGYDATGFPTGTFNANEFALTLGYARQQGVFRYGGNLKLMGSVLESYQAYALAFDFGVNYVHPVQDLVLAINARNIGFAFKDYLEGMPLELPSDLRIGASFKPEHMPIRFHLAARNLIGDEKDFFIPDPANVNAGIGSGDKLFRRLVFGAEVLAHENFHLRLGYNHLIRREFAGSENPGSAGWTGGFSFRVKKFEFSYASMFYQVARASHLFGITTNIRELRTF
ncbi:type IX secretion system protein PorQ [Pararhodonellum marinum]|uniref:type IX secretion system protein PorQ n=1 Tax=Pararhodonellum marinum TaxID=2755358 RepID=UPI001E5638F9|nr:type IX secretion system protein PorQ [Pararhodonellum marinum]